MFNRKIIAAIFVLAALMLQGCHRREGKMQGTWIADSTLGTTNQGFYCGKGGIAASVNQDTVQFTDWSVSRQQLVLAGKRFSGNDVAAFSDTLKIKRRSNDRITLQHDSTLVRYTRTN